MIQDLELAKKETWEEKERLSSKYEEERTKNLASKVSDTDFDLLIFMCMFISVCMVFYSGFVLLTFFVSLKSECYIKMHFT